MKARFVVLFAGSLLLIAGCQTMAQRQAEALRVSMQVANQKIKACVQKIESNPAYQEIAKHTPLNGLVSPTLLQLADAGVPTDEDVQAIIALHNEVSVCRGHSIEDYMQIVPGIIPTTVELYRMSDLITVDLIQRKITWGEANRKRLALKEEYLKNARVVLSQLERDLYVSHQSELAQRQAAWDALAQWGYQQQILMQNQQLINSLNQTTIRRPAITNCTRVGNSVQCSSY